MLGLGLAFGLEALDTRVRSTAELAGGLGGLPLLARIPPPPKKMQKRNELAMVVQPKHNAAEAFRLLRTNLDFVRLSRGRRAHDPRHERHREGGQVDDRGQPGGRRGSCRAGASPWSTSTSAGRTSTASSG